MDFSKAKVILVTDAKQRMYFTGFSSTAGYVVLTEGQTAFVVDSRYYYAAQAQLEPKGIKTYEGADYTVLKQCLAEADAKELGIDFSKTTVAEYAKLQKLGVKLVDVSGILDKQMSVKTESEIENVKKACEIAEKAFRETLKIIKVGMTEKDVATELEYRFKLYGASDKSFDTIVAFGTNSAVPHHETGDRKLKEGMVILMDFGCIYNGYCSDMTRTFTFGIPTRQFAEAYQAVLAAHKAAYDKIEAGMSCVDADKIARDVLTSAGYGEYFTHSLGHGIGLNIHEYPAVSPKGKGCLFNGMIYSLEPGVYLNGKFGIRIEDTVCMVKGKSQSFMTVPKELCVLKDGKLAKYNIK